MNKGKEIQPHIGIFGRMNTGKSSIINVITGQDIAIVSDHAGTTTDPVKKSIEIHGLGPVILIDTAGIDDASELGKQRIQKSIEIIKSIDLAIIVITNNQWSEHEHVLTEKFYDQGVPYICIHNKSDITKLDSNFSTYLQQQHPSMAVIEFSAIKPDNLQLLVNTTRTSMPKTAWQHPSLLGHFLSYGDIVLLITPIDIEAPEGRLILPQIQAIRDILDNDCVAIVLKEREVDSFLRRTGITPKLAVCDTSVILKADASIPKNIPLTGFSIVLAHYKGDFTEYLKGTPKIAELKDGDRILLLESCTHHVSCDDIGRVKIPRWISSFTGKELEFDVVSGLNALSRPITDYALVIQCGGCMITRKQLINRLKPAIDAGIPVTNYGMTIAYVQGIYKRAIAPFVGANSDSEELI